MAFTHLDDIANAYLDGAADWYAFLTQAVAKGWTVVASGDGLSAYSAGSSVFSGGAATGANGMGNPGAWFCIEQPTGGVAPYTGSRQLCVQLGAGAGSGQQFDVRITFSETGSADLTSASATQCALLDDGSGETFVVGSGAPSSPTYANWSDVAVGTRNICFGGPDENFSFYMFLMASAATPGRIFFLDGCTELGGGGAETSPFVICASGTPVSTAINADLALAFFTGSDVGLPVKIDCKPIAWRVHAVDAGICTADAKWGRAGDVAAPGGYKGVSTLFRWTTGGKVARDTLSISGAGAKDRIVLGDLTADWGGSTPA